MAYGRPGFTRRANYYSNPDIIFPKTGTPTGVAGVSNNAKVITQNRRAFAALGDESSVCKSSTRTTTTTTSTTTSTTTKSWTTKNTQKPCMMGYLPYWTKIKYIKNVATWQKCRTFCNEHPDCLNFSYRVIQNVIFKF